MVAGLRLPEHMTFDELLAVVADAHGKPIELREIDASVIPTVTGLWIEKVAKSIILLPAGDTTLHRNHAACHEFGHMLLNHDGCGAPEPSMPSMFKHIGGRSGLKRMLARSLDWNEAEQDAERVAYLLGKALRRKEPGSPNEFEQRFA